jgi:SAM-dependent methyltransferase
VTQEPAGPWDGLLAPEWVPQEIDTTRAHPARIYDYLIGGKNNFAVDRELAERLVTTLPDVRESALANRAFLGRAVRFAVQSGIRQFLDIGTGIPAAGNTHEIAQTLAPDSTVAYVDNDPLVLVHARALMAAAGLGRTTIIGGDLREPKAILDHPEVKAAVDLEQPVALLLVAVLHFLEDADRPHEIVAELRDALAPGSMLILSHGTTHQDWVEGLANFRSTYSQASSGIHLRTVSETERFFDGFDLVDPGLVLLSKWRPDSDTLPLSTESGFLGGVAFLAAR